ncbi:MlaD family protein [Tsukamurella ocularis]|uniref:MlaD family protein n=1 Tax=Tsukamurella ocularis TaxID=1970234 RepID=UPI002169A0FA|nr:MlaD family protein [Tsukamurella ocularis]MCS3779227.1 virulence factor Mce-like protein [Tsukamurella ocularis]MCS3787153.1 virulence factor Mce-like protein [Tsukamurella ocularis]MCS3852544.1 virulence factor Mce-like protein [Tsukamurella ocularis]
MNRPTLRGRISRGLLLLVVLALGVVGVLRASPSTLPDPTTWSTSGWPLRVEFSNALNLPDQAQVRFNGRSVGRMESVRLDGDRAVATLTISEPASIPADTNAELRQDTLLGDVYIALVSAPTSTAQPLRAGGLIPLAQSRPPDHVEDLMTSLSGFLGSGGVSQLGNTVQRIDGAFPDDPARTRKITDNLASTIMAWANDTSSLDTALRSVVGVTGTIAAEHGMLSEYLAPEGLRRWGVISETARVTEVFASLAPLLTNAAPLTPGIRDLAALFTQVISPLLLLDRPVGATRPDNLINLRNLFRDKIIPWVEHGPKVNVVKVSDGPAVPTAEKAEQALRAMRMIGAVR